ncbi:MAG: AAA family ATPase, partial [Bacteroidaceae bacterium]|nr:AAA family ATPase [Bacteroidaceae bacterium]
MPHTIAVAGKGGVGKTTTCGMLIDYLYKKKSGPVLVVDADANSNLNEVLGVEVETSLGAIREEMAQAELKGTIPKGMTKADYAELKFNSALVEEDDFDMLVMGRTQGKGPLLVVDADANSNLNEVLGVDVDTTLGEIREEMARAEMKGTIPAGMTKADYAEFKFNSALIEEDDFDMLV